MNATHCQTYATATTLNGRPAVHVVGDFGNFHDVGFHTPGQAAEAAAERNAEKRARVIFRMFRGEVLALFPAFAGTNDPADCTCYAHVGQHGGANYRDITRASRLATPDEYRPLAAELERVGYRLEVIARATRADYLQRRADCYRL